MQTVTIPQAFDLALQHLGAGRLAEAEAIYRQILTHEPNNAGSLHNLGVIANQTGRHELAAEMIRRAIAMVPNDPVYYSNLGIACRKLGRLDEAVAAYRRAVELKPDFAGAYSNLGNALRDRGNLDDAIAAYRRALELKPDSAEARNNLGTALTEKNRIAAALNAFSGERQFSPDDVEAHVRVGHVAIGQGRLNEAIAAYRRVLELRPDHFDAQNNLAAALGRQGRMAEALAACRRAIDLKPGDAGAHNNLGVALKNLGRIEEAFAAYRMAVQIKPDYGQAHVNLGNAAMDDDLLDEAIAAYGRASELLPDQADVQNNLAAAFGKKGRFDEALTACRRAIELRPDYADAYNNLGSALRNLERIGEAIAAYRRAIELKPDYAEACNNLGKVLQDNGDLDGAIAAQRRALEINPGYDEACYNLGNALKDDCQIDEAILAYRRAIQLKPDYAEALNNLASALNEMGRVEEGISLWRSALRITPDSALFHSNILLLSHVLPDLEAGALFQEHRRWNEDFARPLEKFIAPHGNACDPGRRLRVGYVSRDFCEHPVVFFIESLLASHDRDPFEVFCYADVHKPDSITSRLKKHVPQWRNIDLKKDAEVAELIREDGIDILVDLAGQTTLNRLLVFARKPAPVQVTYLGYMDTTGMSTMDYRLTDAHADPPGTTEHLHSEELVRLPDVFACFRPADESPPVGPLPALTRGSVTFASFHTLAKLNVSLLERWAEILLRVPGSRLLLVATAFNEMSARKQLSEFFAGKGVGSERLQFKGRQSLRDYLALHNEVDVLLDSDPCSGHTVCCHALWMGVPVVTLEGGRYWGRMVAGVLANLNLPELIAHTPDEYVKIACDLAANPSRLADLRSTMRERMKASALMDAARFTRNVEHAYREMWRAWCAKPSP